MPQISNFSNTPLRQQAGFVSTPFPVIESLSRRSSSVVEHLFRKQRVTGSIPVSGSLF